jgi:hypothetical protein
MNIDQILRQRSQPTLYEEDEGEEVSFDESMHGPDEPDDDDDR